MRIGVELRQLVPGASGGLVPHMQGVLEALFRAHSEQEVVLYCTPENEILFPSVPPQVRRLALPVQEYYPLMDRLAGEQGLDVLFCTYPRDLALSFPLARQVIFIPDLQHEFFPEFFSPAVLADRRASCNRALEGAGALGTNSEHARQAIATHPRTRCTDVFLMGPGTPAAAPAPEPEELTAAERASLPAAPFFFYPANLWPHKNHRRLLQAFELLVRQERTPVELVFTGHPDGWTELRDAFPRLPVRHLGYVRRPLLRELLRRAQALVVFSLFEGFGMPLLEAFQAGTPVVCSNTASLPEVGGDAVLTCDPLDPEAMCAGLHALLHDAELRQRLTARGRERLRLYTWEGSAANLVDACRRVAERWETRPPPPPRGRWQSLLQHATLPGQIARRVRLALRARLRPHYHPWTHDLTVRVHRFLTPRLGSIQQHPPQPLVVPPHYARVRPPRPVPVISLVTPCGDETAFLEHARDSVLQQSYPRLEHILQPLEGGEELGLAQSLNRGFRRATGDILASLRADDVLLPGALAFVARYFHQHPEVDVVYGHRIIIDANNQEVGRWILPPHDDEVLLWQDYVPPETLFWRRRVWEKVGATFDETFRSASDWDLLVRLRTVGARLVRLPRFLAAYRVPCLESMEARLVEVGLPEMRRIRARCHGRDVGQQEVEQHVAAYLRRHVLYDRLYRLGLLGC